MRFGAWVLATVLVASPVCAAPDLREGLQRVHYKDCGAGGAGVLKITVEPSGQVSWVRVEAGNYDAPTSVCLWDRFRKATFPPFKGEAVDVLWPINLGAKSAPEASEPEEEPTAKPTLAPSASSVPQRLHAELDHPTSFDGGGAPVGRHAVRTRSTGLIVGGALAFGIVYLATAAQATYRSSNAWAIPLIGPIIAGRSNDTAAPLSAAVQIVGATLLIIGILNVDTTYVPNDPKGVHFTPLLGKGLVGIGFVAAM